MGLESATYLNDLVITNPVGGTDTKSQGDNHIRLLKEVLKNSFPSLDHAIYLERPRADLASAATTNIGAQTTEYVNITGTTTITSLGTAAAGIWRFVRFNGVLTLTHNATSLILPGGASIVTAAGDAAIFMSEGSGNWKCLAYLPLAGVIATALAAALLVTESETILGNDNDTTVPTSAAVKDLVTGQQTIWVPAAAMKGRTTNGAAPGFLEMTTNDNPISYLAYDPTTKEGAGFCIQMPKGWDEGTIIAQFVWTHPATTTNFGVSWEIAAVACANDDPLDVAYGTLVEIDDTGGTTHDCYISDEAPPMTVAGSPGAEEFVQFLVTRDPADAGDTLAVDAWLLGVKLHYTTNTPKDD